MPCYSVGMANTATRSEIQAETSAAVTNFVIIGTGSAHTATYRALSAWRDPDTGLLWGYAEARRSLSLVRWAQVDHTLRHGWQLRVHVTWAEDTGDVAGTLRFDAAPMVAVVNTNIGAAAPIRAAA